MKFLRSLCDHLLEGVIAYNTDGEMFGKHNFIDVECVPLAIELIMTKHIFKRHFKN